MKPKIGSDICDCCDAVLGDAYQLITNAICSECYDGTIAMTVSDREVAAQIVDMTESMKEKSRFAMVVRSLAIAELTGRHNVG